MSDETGLTVDLAQPGWADAPETLVTLLNGHDSGPIVMVGTNCPALPTALVQVIISTRKTMEPRGIPVSITDPSDDLRDGLRTIGLESAVLDGEGVA